MIETNNLANGWTQIELKKLGQALEEKQNKNAKAQRRKVKPKTNAEALKRWENNK